MKKRKLRRQAIADAASSLQHLEDRIKTLDRRADKFLYQILREERVIKRERLYSLLIAN